MNSTEPERTRVRVRRKVRTRIPRRKRGTVRIAIGLAVLAVTIISVWAYLWRTGLIPDNQSVANWYETEHSSTALVNLPADDAPHANYMEWWYYNGHLWTGDDKKYSFHYVFFLVNALSSFTVAHASFIDHQTGKRYTVQRRSAGNPSSGRENSFEFVLGNWSMAGGNGKDRLTLETPEFSFDLALTSTRPPVLQGGTGLLDFKTAGSSYYYSRPRMRISGTAAVGNDRHPVTGQAWFDHQWGDFRTTLLGWDWFAIQLTDGADIMLYLLQDSNGETVLRSGTYSRHGQTEVLNAADFETHITDFWTSPTTGVSYPVNWTIKIPSKNIQLALSPMIREGEFDGRVTSYLVYWEGPIKITGSHNGIGFLESTGYPGQASKKKNNQ